MLLATLKLDKRFKFDTTKRGMMLPDKAFKEEMKRLNHDGKAPYPEHDLCIDLREYLKMEDAYDLK